MGCGTGQKSSLGEKAGSAEEAGCRSTPRSTTHSDESTTHSESHAVDLSSDSDAESERDLPSVSPTGATAELLVAWRARARRRAALPPPEREGATPPPLAVDPALPAIQPGEAAVPPPAAPWEKTMTRGALGSTLTRSFRETHLGACLRDYARDLRTPTSRPADAASTPSFGQPTPGFGESPADRKRRKSSDASPEPPEEDCVELDAAPVVLFRRDSAVLP